MTHALATAALLVSLGNPLPKTVDTRGGQGSAIIGSEVDVFGDTKYRLVVYWGYDGYYWNGKRIEFSGFGEWPW